MGRSSSHSSPESITTGAHAEIRLIWGRAGDARGRVGCHRIYWHTSGICDCDLGEYRSFESKVGQMGREFVHLVRNVRWRFWRKAESHVTAKGRLQSGRGRAHHQISDALFARNATRLLRERNPDLTRGALRRSKRAKSEARFRTPQRAGTPTPSSAPRGRCRWRGR
jgi:hypothetical protein